MKKIIVRETDLSKDKLLSKSCVIPGCEDFDPSRGKCQYAEQVLLLPDTQRSYYKYGNVDLNSSV